MNCTWRNCHKNNGHILTYVFYFHMFMRRRNPKCFPIYSYFTLENEFSRKKTKSIMNYLASQCKPFDGVKHYCTTENVNVLFRVRQLYEEKKLEFNKTCSIIYSIIYNPKSYNWAVNFSRKNFSISASALCKANIIINIRRPFEVQQMSIRDFYSFKYTTWGYNECISKH